LTLEPRLISISSINQKSLDKFVKIQGYVVSPGIIEDKNKTYSFTVFKIQDNSSEINVYFEKPLKLNAFQQLEIIGKVSSYENQLQIQSYKLKILG
jgi:RecJ-like exonuclease